VDNNYLDMGMNKSGYVHTLPSGRLNSHAYWAPKHNDVNADDLLMASVELRVSWAPFSTN
jgi:hypothetical protein